MFGHLKAEDFVDLMDGGGDSDGRRQHLARCAECRSRWEATAPLHAGMMASADSGTDIPEPDWADFRGAGRDQLFSRSVRRPSSFGRWTGWPGWSVRPALVWALSVVLIVGLTTITMLWKTDTPAPAPIASV